jgi:spermidine synthase
VDSALSGRILVEEVALAGEGGEGESASRRMVFAANPNLVQSEVRLLPCGAIDAAHLACNYHAAIVAGLAVAVPSLLAAASATADAATLPQVMVIGLGGGALPAFLAAHFRLRVHCVELDAAVAALAVSHFGFTEGPQLSLAIGCGLAAVAAAAPGSLDAIVLDAGSGDASLGMTCPPPAFLEPPFLAAAAAALRPGGTLAVNCVSRSPHRMAAALLALRAAFPVLLQAEAEEAFLNRVVFACAAAPPAAAEPHTRAAAAAALRAAAAAPFDEEMDLESLAEGMRTLARPEELEALD